MFFDAGEREAARLENAEAWDETEHYHAFDEICARNHGTLALSFAKISRFAGVLIAERYRELSVPRETRVKCDR
jgi:hypothetical protein